MNTQNLRKKLCGDNMLLQNTIRKIKKSFGRYFSLIVIVFIGAALFGSLQLCAPSIKNVQKKYYDDTHLMDLKITGTLGLTDQDVKSLKQLKSVNQAVGSYSKEVLDDSKTVKIHAIEDEINGFQLVEGTMPRQNDECLADASHYQVGDIIKITEPENQNDLKNKTFKVTGTIHSPLYTGTNYGSSQIGDGKLYSYLFVLKDVFQYDAYTEIYLTMNQSTEYQIYSTEYNKHVETLKKEIQQIQKKAEQRRYDELTSDLVTKLDQLKTLNNMMPNATYQENIQKLEDAIAMVGESKWYLLDRYDSVISYKILEMQYDEVQILANIIPFFFLVVVLLMTSNTMMRMITEERSEMGAMTSIGVSNLGIMRHYVIYVLTSTMLGTLLGYFFGSYVLTPLFYSCFPVEMPDLQYQFHFSLFFVLLIFISLLMLAVTIYSCNQVFRLRPAELLRPASPKSGKGIMLERISWLWNRFSFSWKITIRNIARYKKRVFMTIVGTAGCTFLILIGFGIQDSIDGVGTKQYHEILKYDNMIVLKNSITTISNELNEDLEKSIKSPLLLNQTIFQVNTTTDDMDAYVIAPEEADQTFYQYFVLKSNHDHKTKKLSNNEVYVTTQIARRCDIEKGDKITLEDGDGNTYQVIVGDIIENYVSNYIYMTRELYEKTFETKWNGNVIVSKNKINNETKIANSLLDSGNVLSVQFSNDLLHDVNSGISGLNNVIFVLIIIASLLAISVLYNLTSINISERIREISTLKVLGYTDGEAERYIYRETIIMVIVGIIIGLIITPMIHHEIVNLLQNDETLLLEQIEYSSYIYASLLTFIFAIIMQVVTYFKLKKIDMIEALKSVE